MALAALTRAGGNLKQPGKVAIMDADGGGQRLAVILKHEQPRLRLHGGDDFAETGPQGGIEIVHDHCRTEKPSDILHGDLMHRRVDRHVALERRTHDQRFGKACPPLLVEELGELAARQWRQAEGERPPIGLEAPPRARNPLRYRGNIARVERIDRVETLCRMTGGEPRDPGAVIVHRRRGPGAKGGGLEAPDHRQARSGTSS